MKREDLPALELRVLEELTTSRSTISTISLAADLWQSDAPHWGADPVGLVQMLIESLGEMGLLIYRMQPAYVVVGDPPDAYKGFATNIRLSKEGWTLMGYPNRAYQVGTRDATNVHLDPKGDRTNFRKHGDKAEGIGPIERLPYAEHMAKYPTHIHRLSTDEVENQMPRTYTKVTDALEGTVLAYRSRFPLDSYDEIADATGIPKRTIQYILTELPRLRRMSDGDQNEKTQKERILDCLSQLDFKNVPALVRTLGRGDSAHDVVHALHDLKKQQLVDFDERGTGQKEPQNIKLTNRGRKAMSVVISETDPNPLVGETQEEAVARRASERTQPYEASKRILEEATETIDAVVEAVLEAAPPESNDYPELDALLDREKRRLDADAKAMNYLQAADIVRDTDPETAAILEQKAAESDIPHPSPLESEYLRYVRNHG